MALLSRPILFLLLTASFASTALAAAKTGSSAPQATPSSVFVQASCTLPEPGLPLCSIQGQSDFYGLGVRMGIYFTWLTSWIANNFLAEEISGSLDTNAVFLLAISVTVIFNSIWGTLRILDALILLQLCYGFLFGVMSLWGYRTMFGPQYHRLGAEGQSRFGGFGTHLRLLLMTAISGFAVWFWFEGLDDGLNKCNKREACGGLRVFFFADVRLYGWIRVFYQISAIGCLLYYGIMTIVAAVWLVVRCAKFVKHGKQGWTQGYERDGKVDTGFSQRELSYAYLFLTGFNFFWMLMSALNVEFTLNFNHVTGVLGESGLSGPGQQLPLLIGALSFLRICWLVFNEYYLERDKSTEETRGLDTARAATLSAGTESAPATPAASRFPQQQTYFNGLPLLAVHSDRPWAHRMLVAYLPWLTDFDSFRSPRSSSNEFEPASTDAPALEMRKTSYKSSGVDVDVESVGSRKAGPSAETKV